MAFYPLKKLHPDYQNGRRKPSGLLELDLSLDLAKRARHFYIPQNVGKCRNLGYDRKSADLIAVESGNQYAEGFGATQTELKTHSAYANFGYPFTMYTRFICKTAIPSGTKKLNHYGDLSQSDYVGVTATPFLVRGDLTLNFVGYSADVSTSAHKTVGAVTDIIYECVSSTEKTAYVWVDGLFIGSTTNSTDSSSHDAALGQFDETRPAVDSTYFDVICTGLFDGQIADKDAFTRNPYQLLKPSIDVLWFLGGGGATYTLTADVNAITLGSDSVSLLANRNLDADVNAITLSSDAVTLTANRVLSADVNAVVLGSDSVSLTANRLLTADVNAITLSSDAVTLTYNSGATYTLTADANVITLGGDSVSLLTSRVLTADVSAIVLGGDSVTLTTGVVDTDDCYVWLQSQIVDTHYLTSEINLDEYIVAAIDAGVTFIESELYTEESTTVYVTSAIDGDVIYLESKVCH